MKLLPFLLTVLAASFGFQAHAQNPPGFKELAIGDPAPDFKLPDTDGNLRALADFADAKVLAVAFTSNHCPTSNAAFPRLIALYKELADKGFGVVAINPNHPEALRPDELGYSKYGDSYPEMKLHARDAGFPFPYLYDGETQTTAMTYGCLATPHVFLFDANRNLRYKGWIDDSRFPAADTVTRPDLANAVRALLDGKPVPVATTRPIGCSTKWRMKREQVAADDEKWANLPVTVEDIDADGVRKLRANSGGRHRLIHVWSTTCGSCVAEFPGVARVARRMGLRDFELVTISTDVPETREKVAAFLRKQGAGLPPHLRKTIEKEERGTNSYLFTGASLAPLVEALDPAWDGPQPHTILIKPDGQIGFRHTGPLTEEQLLEKVLAVMTPFYQP